MSSIGREWEAIEDARHSRQIDREQAEEDSRIKQRERIEQMTVGALMEDAPEPYRAHLDLLICGMCDAFERAQREIHADIRGGGYV